MTRKDYIVIADAMVKQIQCMYVKKRDIQSHINIMCNHLRIDNNSFDADKFHKYIKERI